MSGGFSVSTMPCMARSVFFTCLKRTLDAGDAATSTKRLHTHHLAVK
jgi:hypothetical protein